MNKRSAKREACWLASSWIENGMTSWTIEGRYSPSDLTRVYKGLDELVRELFQRGMLPAAEESEK